MSSSRLVFIGVALWSVGTIGIRLAGHLVLQPGHPGKVVFVYVVSFLLMAWAVRRMCRRMSLLPEAWPRAAVLLALPTLALDPFSCVFLNMVFPNLDPGAAGLFGGWMLSFCGGALAGAIKDDTRLV